MSTLHLNSCDQEWSSSRETELSGSILWSSVYCILINQRLTDQVKRHCLTLYVNGMGFRAIEHGSILGRRILPKNFRCTGVNHNTVIQWVKQSGEQLADAPESQMIPELAQIDQLQTFVGSKNTKSGSGRQSMGMKQES